MLRIKKTEHYQSVLWNHYHKCSENIMMYLKKHGGVNNRKVPIQNNGHDVHNTPMDEDNEQI